MLIIKNAKFYRSFSNYFEIPDSFFKEIAFVGKSNVGKSSLINDICNQKIAKVSSEPGKTRLINFFLINNSFYFVDLPGYGYAKTSKSIIKKWPELIENYLAKRKQLKIIFFILDIRRELNEHDKFLNEWFKNNTGLKTYYIISKVDKLSINERNKQKELIARELDVKSEDLILYSVNLKIGKEDVLRKIEA
jgi:GTP-binding protein